MSEMERDTERVSSLEIVGSKGNGDEIEGKVTCNGEIVRTSEPLKNGSMSVGGESTKDSFDVAGSEPLDTRWRGDEEALTDLNYKDPPRNGHTPDSSSSEDDDETEGGAFAANWYVPLPQDPQESDEEEAEEEEEWSKGAAGLLQDPQDEESEHQPDQNASGSLKEVKPTSKMEDSESIITASRLRGSILFVLMKTSGDLPYTTTCAFHILLLIL